MFQVALAYDTNSEYRVLFSAISILLLLLLLLLLNYYYYYYYWMLISDSHTRKPTVKT